jgi:hypothetical protein
LYYYNNANVLTPPKILIVETPGLNNEIYQLEHDTGLYIDSENSLYEITKCIKNINTAELDLDYYCLDLMSNSCDVSADIQTKAILCFLSWYGKVLFNHLKQLGVYQNGILPYSFRHRKVDTICLMRSHDLMNEIKKELYLDGLYSKTSSDTDEYRRAV